MIPHPPTSTLFPYTTLFRSIACTAQACKPADVKSPRAAVLQSRQARMLVENLVCRAVVEVPAVAHADRKSTRLNSSHPSISYAVFCLKKKKTIHRQQHNCNT